MQVTRQELFPFVHLTHIKADKFKSAQISVHFLTQHTRETASLDSLLAPVLMRCSKKYQDYRHMLMHCAELYDVIPSPTSILFGEIHDVGMGFCFCDNRFLPPGSRNILGEVCQLIRDFLFEPQLVNGSFRAEDVNLERDNMLDAYNARINDKRSYAYSRCIEEMCVYENYGIGRLGNEDTISAVTPKALTKRYNELISTSPVEIFYTGADSVDDVTEYIKKVFADIPRGEINLDIGSDIRMNSVEEHVREVYEKANVLQGKMVMGFRIGEYMEDFSLAELTVFNLVFGGGVTSKLFVNVREKMSLCYYSSSGIKAAKGVMFVSSGVDAKNFVVTRDEIYHQLDLIKQGDISDYEMESAKTTYLNILNSIEDSIGSIESFVISNTIHGLDTTPEEFAEEIMAVDKEALVTIANSIVPDLIFYLTPNDYEGSEDGKNE